MRRFVADASHELRTPLTSIRGFAELYRQGAVRTEDDVRRLMGRIEAEGARMGMLVEDLLLLARLDQQRPLTIGPGRPGRDRRRRRPRRPRRPAGPPDRPAPGRVARRRPGRAGRRGPAAAGGRQPGHQRAHPHPARHPGDRHRRRRTTTRRPRAAGRRRGAGHGRRPTPTGPSSASTGWTPPGRGRPAAPASAWPSSPPSWPRTAGRSDLVTAPGEGATFAVRLPRGGPARARRRPGAAASPASRPVTIRG